MLRRLLSIAVAVQLAFAPIANAGVPFSFRAPIPEDTARFLKTMSGVMAGAGRKAMALSPMNKAELQKKIREGMKQAAVQPAKTLAHNAQTLMMLWILGAVEAIHQQEHLRPLMKEDNIRNPQNLLEHIYNWWDLGKGVGGHMLQSVDLWASLVGGSVGSVSGMPVQMVINQLAQGMSTRPFLQKLLTSGTASFITFVGFEAGKRVIDEAIFLLDEEDIKTAKELKFMTLFMGGGTAHERAVFAKIMANVSQILTFARPGAMQSWIYNTWRLNIATGDFVTMLSSMVLAGVAAGTLIPGAGWIVGMCFGLIGGFAAIFIPKEYKRPITDGIRASRAHFGEQRMYTTWLNLQPLLKAAQSEYPIGGHAYIAKQIEANLAQRAGYREDAMTALFEQAYDAYLRIQEGDMGLNLISGRQQAAFKKLIESKPVITTADINEVVASTPQEIYALQVEFERERREGRERFNYYFEKILEVQKKEAAYFGPLVYGQLKEDNPAQRVLAKFMKDQELIHLSMRQMLAGLMPEKVKDLGLQDTPKEELEKLPAASLILLNLFYMRGFSERDLLEE